VAEGHRHALAEEIWGWASGNGIARLIILSGCSSHVKVDADFAVATQLRYVGELAPGDVGKLAPGEPMDSNWLPLGHALSEEALQGKDPVLTATQFLLRHGGVTRALLNAATRDAAAFEGAKPGTPTLALLGMMNEVDLLSTEQFTRATFAFIAASLGIDVPELQKPLTWCVTELKPTPEQIW